jgi:protein-S-isoprenylcysteine O-methyltransferase Ste14
MSVKKTAAARTVIWFVLAPGAVAGLVPWWITRWQSSPYTSPVLGVTGAALVLGGSAVLIHAAVRFVTEGLGTPAPVAPTRKLVLGGLYRYVRNPMYLAVLAVIIGQTLWLARVNLVVYGVLITLFEAAFVTHYEEPALRRTFGQEYDSYRLAVRGWVPRLHAWHPNSGQP